MPSSACSRSGRFATILALLAGASAVAVEPATRPAVPDYSAYTQSYHLPLTTRPSVDPADPGERRVNVSLNGGPPLAMDVDTGSVGIVVDANLVPNRDVTGPPGIVLDPRSGIEWVGAYTKATVTFPDTKDAHGQVATAVVPVLAITGWLERRGATTGPTTQPTTMPQVLLFGVGHGCGTEGHPERNPWLNLQEMDAGTMRRGYTITRDGVTLGLTAQTVGDGFVFEKLTERPVSAETAAMKPGLKDWRNDAAPTTRPTTTPAATRPAATRPLAVYDDLFDNDGGYVGLRPVAQPRP